MLTRLTVTSVALSAMGLASVPVLAEESDSPVYAGATWSTSTAGSPIGLANGDWLSRTGTRDRLEVDFAAAAGPASTTWQATWTSQPVLSLVDGEALAFVIVADADHTSVQETLTDSVLALRYKLAGEGWSAWREAPMKTVNSRSARESELIGAGVGPEQACDCEVQVQFRWTGRKSGLDVSRLVMHAAIKGAHSVE